MLRSGAYWDILGAKQRLVHPLVFLEVPDSLLQSLCETKLVVQVVLVLKLLHFPNGCLLVFTLLKQVWVDTISFLAVELLFVFLDSLDMIRLGSLCIVQPLRSLLSYPLVKSVILVLQFFRDLFRVHHLLLDA